MPQQPNIILILTDQHRADCLGIEGHPLVQTPVLDLIGRSGFRFSNAYTACPVCVPARRTIMSGQRPATHGVLHNVDTLLHGATLAQTLRDGGYQTFLSGKLHLWPIRKAYGFESMMLSDGPGYSPEEKDSDYLRFLQRNEPGESFPQIAGGQIGDGSIVRPWHLDERLHVANWATSCAIDFLERRDPTRPFFLNLSYFHPHPPLMPPTVYYDRYKDADDVPPPCGAWAEAQPHGGIGDGSDTRRFDRQTRARTLRSMRLAYYAQINHINDQVSRLRIAMRLLGIPWNETLILYASDHGEMLGDHGYTEKRGPYQGSVRVPFMLRLPDSMARPMGVRQEGQVMAQPVELMDIMPTLLDAASLGIPATVEGRSVLPLLRDPQSPWRPYVHGEIAHSQPSVVAGETGMHYLTDGKSKYIWYPGVGREEFFDLENDPRELRELISTGAVDDMILQTWRSRLISELRGRPEGFTDGERLLQLKGPTARSIPAKFAPPATA